MESVDFIEYAARIPTLTPEQRTILVTLLGPQPAAQPAGLGAAHAAPPTAKKARKPAPTGDARRRPQVKLSDLAVYAAVGRAGRAHLVPAADRALAPPLYVAALKRLVGFGLLHTARLGQELTYLPADPPATLRYAQLSTPAAAYVRAGRVGPYLSRDDLTAWLPTVGHPADFNLFMQPGSFVAKLFEKKVFGWVADPAALAPLPPVERLPDEPPPPTPPGPVAPAAESESPQPQEAP